MQKYNEESLKSTARKIRSHIIQMTSLAGSGHPGPSFSIVEILTMLYFHKMRYDPADPDWEQRDRFVLSKGHAAPALYGTLIELGVYSTREIKNFRRINSPFQGHPDGKVPGIDATTGSLGIGLSQAVGMALAAKRRSLDLVVYGLIGDGECNEGQIWEAALFAQHHKLDNLVIFLDNNGDQFEGAVKEVLDISPLGRKWEAFGWEVYEFNGHDFSQIRDFLNSIDAINGKPKLGIAHTVKGFGVSFMEGNHDYHAKSLNEDETRQALIELAED
jgi:transketolase